MTQNQRQRYRSLKQSGWHVQILLGLVGCLFVFNDIAQGIIYVPGVPKSTITGLGIAGNLISTAGLPLVLVQLGFFIEWLQTAIANLPAINAPNAKAQRWYSWFLLLPILNFIPAMALQEIWKASDPQHLDDESWQTSSSSILINAWWILSLLAVCLTAPLETLVGAASYMKLLPAQAALPLRLVAIAMTIGTSLTGLFIVRNVTSRMESKRALLCAQEESTSTSSAESNQSTTERTWCFSRENQSYGPIPETELADLLIRRQISPETFVWTPGLKEWIKASQSPNIAATINQLLHQQGPNHQTPTPDDEMPESAYGLNWGAFLLTWIWGIGNESWIALLSWVPLIGFAMPWILLFKGNEMAWRNKKWRDVDHFQRNQRRWAIAGSILMPLWIGCLILLALPSFNKGLEEGRVFRIQSEMTMVEKAAQAYAKAHAGQYPVTMTKDFQSLISRESYNENGLTNALTEKDQWPTVLADVKADDQGGYQFPLSEIKMEPCQILYCPVDHGQSFMIFATGTKGQLLLNKDSKPECRSPLQTKQDPTQADD